MGFGSPEGKPSTEIPLFVLFPTISQHFLYTLMTRNNSKTKRLFRLLFLKVVQPCPTICCLLLYTLNACSILMSDKEMIQGIKQHRRKNKTKLQ